LGLSTGDFASCRSTRSVRTAAGADGGAAPAADDYGRAITGKEVARRGADPS